jgi:hypothetical protein
VVVIVSGAEAMVRLRVALLFWTGEPESVTLKVKDAALTGTVGIPLISPLDALRVKPLGSVPAVNCQLRVPVPPVAVRVFEYATPAWPFGRDVVVIVRGAGAIVTVKLAFAV